MAPKAAHDAPLTDFAVDRAAEVPIGVQLVWAIRAAIDDGRLEPGRRLPGLRDLAEALAINANTVRAVYARLGREGLVESRQGSGTFVAASATGALPQASRIAAGAAREAMRRGVDPRDVAAALYVGAEQRTQPLDASRTRTERRAQPGAGGTEAEGARRADLRAQIAALEQALGELEAGYPSLAPRRASNIIDAASRDGATARLPSAEELEQTRLMLLRRLASLQARIDGLRQPAGSVDAKKLAAQTAAGENVDRERSPKAGRARAKTSSRPAAAGI